MIAILISAALQLGQSPVTQLGADYECIGENIRPYFAFDVEFDREERRLAFIERIDLGEGEIFYAIQLADLAKSPVEIQTVQKAKASVSSIAFNRKGDRLYATEGSRLRAWKVADLARVIDADFTPRVVADSGPCLDALASSPVEDKVYFAVRWSNPPPNRKFHVHIHSWDEATGDTRDRMAESALQSEGIGFSPIKGGLRISPNGTRIVTVPIFEKKLKVYDAMFGLQKEIDMDEFGWPNAWLTNDRWDVVGHNKNALVVYDFVEGRASKRIPLVLGEYYADKVFRTQNKSFLRAVHRKTEVPHVLDLNLDEFVAGRQKIEFGRETDVQKYGRICDISPSGRHMLTAPPDDNIFAPRIQIWRRK